MLTTILKIAERHRVVLGFCFGVALVVVGYSVYSQINKTFFRDHEDEEVHVHADFSMSINGEQIDFSTDKYQSSLKQILHEDFHFHDNNDAVIHRHAADLTLADFLASLGFTLAANCLTTDTDKTYCTKDDSALRLYVNGEVRADVLSYIPEDEDRILVYYGNINDPAIDQYLTEITDEACIYSGTCPERGIPPPESCGLTCEI